MQLAGNPARSARPTERRAGHYSYVLITPARNEATFIELTIKSVVGQTVRPAKWVIVSDGSTDGTDEVVKKYAAQHDWIELVRQPERTERHFAGKADAFNAGYGRVKDLEYEVIGNLDADVSFEEDYFAFLMSKFAENPGLGVAGTPYREGKNVTYDYRFASIEDVAGACQMFRRECFEAIGGYRPIRSGGIDLIAVLSARAQGWQTRTFTEKVCLHHRKSGSACHTGLREGLHRGRKDYLLGSHPAWEVLRSVYQMKSRPYIVGGVLSLVGYFWAMLRRVERTIPEELIEVRRNDQMQRLKGILRQRLVLFNGSSMWLRNTYYLLKPAIPWALRMVLRRFRARRLRRRFSTSWPINEATVRAPAGWPGWPDGKQFAFVLTHDVEGKRGLDRCRWLAEMEMGLGFRSSFNFVPEGEYTTPESLRGFLNSNGFEVGVHDLRHDGTLYRSWKTFKKDAQKINHYLTAWGAVGFRSGFMFHNLGWLQDLHILYDASTFDTDPFEPQPDGMNTIFPFWVPRKDCTGYVELPYTLPQDSTLFLLFQEASIDTWVRKLDWVAAHGGLALVNVHPDYMSFNGRRSPSEYGAALYGDFLEYVNNRYRSQGWFALPRDVAKYVCQHKPPLPERTITSEPRRRRGQT